MFPLDLSFSSLHVFCFVEKQFLLLLKIQSFFCTRLPESRPKYNLLLYPAVHHSLCYTLLYRRRALGFSVLRFWLFFGSVSLFLCKKNSVFLFWCLLRFADLSFFSMWFQVFAKNTNGFSDLISDAVFSFSYLNYLGSGFSLI